VRQLERIVGVTAVAGAGEVGSGDDDEAGPFGPEHLEGRDVAHAHAEAGVGNLDLLCGAGDALVGDHHVTLGMGVSNQVVVGVLQEGGYGRGLVPGAVGPGAGGLQARHHGGIGFEEEGVGSLAGPGREVVVDGVELASDLVDAEDRSLLVGVIDPVPERGQQSKP